MDNDIYVRTLAKGGRPVYYHPRSKTSHWTLPVGRDVTLYERKRDSSGKQSLVLLTEYSERPAGPLGRVGPNLAAPQEHPALRRVVSVCGQWVACVHPKYQRQFFCRIADRVSVWSEPAGVQFPQHYLEAQRDRFCNPGASQPSQTVKGPETPERHPRPPTLPDRTDVRDDALVSGEPVGSRGAPSSEPGATASAVGSTTRPIDGQDTSIESTEINKLKHRSVKSQYEGRGEPVAAGQAADDLAGLDRGPADRPDTGSGTGTGSRDAGEQEEETGIGNSNTPAHEMPVSGAPSVAVSVSSSVGLVAGRGGIALRPRDKEIKASGLPLEAGGKVQPAGQAQNYAEGGGVLPPPPPPPPPPARLDRIDVTYSTATSDSQQDSSDREDGHAMGSGESKSSGSEVERASGGMAEWKAGSKQVRSRRVSGASIEGNMDGTEHGGELPGPQQALFDQSATMRGPDVDDGSVNGSADDQGTVSAGAVSNAAASIGYVAPSEQAPKAPTLSSKKGTATTEQPGAASGNHTVPMPPHPQRADDSAPAREGSAGALPDHVNARLTSALAGLDADMVAGMLEDTRLRKFVGQEGEDVAQGRTRLRRQMQSIGASALVCDEGRHSAGSSPPAPRLGSYASPHSPASPRGQEVSPRHRVPHRAPNQSSAGTGLRAPYLGRPCLGSPAKRALQRSRRGSLSGQAELPDSEPQGGDSRSSSHGASPAGRISESKGDEVAEHPQRRDAELPAVATAAGPPRRRDKREPGQQAKPQPSVVRGPEGQQRSRRIAGAVHAFAMRRGGGEEDLVASQVKEAEGLHEGAPGSQPFQFDAGGHLSSDLLRSLARTSTRDVDEVLGVLALATPGVTIKMTDRSSSSSGSTGNRPTGPNDGRDQAAEEGRGPAQGVGLGLGECMHIHGSENETHQAHRRLSSFALQPGMSVDRLLAAGGLRVDEDRRGEAGVLRVDEDRRGEEGMPASGREAVSGGDGGGSGATGGGMPDEHSSVGGSIASHGLGHVAHSEQGSPGLQSHHLASRSRAPSSAGTSLAASPSPALGPMTQGGSPGAALYREHPTGSSSGTGPENSAESGTSDQVLAETTPPPTAVPPLQRRQSAYLSTRSLLGPRSGASGRSSGHMSHASAVEEAEPTARQGGSSDASHGQDGASTGGESGQEASSLFPEGTARARAGDSESSTTAATATMNESTLRRALREQRAAAERAARRAERLLEERAGRFSQRSSRAEMRSGVGVTIDGRRSMESSPAGKGKNKGMGKGKGGEEEDGVWADPADASSREQQPTSTSGPSEHVDSPSSGPPFGGGSIATGSSPGSSRRSSLAMLDGMYTRGMLGMRAPRGRAAGLGGQVQAVLRGSGSGAGSGAGSASNGRGHGQGGGESEAGFGHSILVDALLQRAGGWSSKQEAARRWGGRTGR